MVAVVRLHKFLCLFMLKGPSIFSFQCHVRTFSYSSHHLRFRSFCFHTRPFGGVVGGVLWKHCHSLRSLQWPTYCFAAPTTRSLPPKAVYLKPESAHYIVTDYFVSPQEWNTWTCLKFSPTNYGKYLFSYSYFDPDKCTALIWYVKIITPISSWGLKNW